jgi:hypothetical protein
MSFKSFDTGPLLTAAFLLGLACLPVLAIIFAARASKPKDRLKTFEETYPNEHRFI